METTSLLLEPQKRCVLYFRVSTEQQGRSGLGLDAQRTAVACCVSGAEVLGEFVEVESGRAPSRNKRKRRRVSIAEYRPQLAAALDLCKREGAELVIAKLDRLSRDVVTIFELRDSGVRFRACDLPEFNTLTLAIFAAFAQYESERISERTSDALAEKKTRTGEWRKSPLTPELRAKGVETNRKHALENSNNRRASFLLESLQGKGYTLQKKADLLNANEYRTSRGCKFTASSVRLLEMRMQEATPPEVL
jgi:DNA invertase Pin-like site-specific DNA recombinase